MSLCSTIALIVAAGEGSRFGGPKPYAPLAGIPLIRHAVEAFLAHPGITGVQVVMHPDHAALYREALAGIALPPPVKGGATRQESVRRGLEAIAPLKPDYVLIHDAARPNVPHALIDAVLAGLMRGPAAIPVRAMTETVKRVEDHAIKGTVPREHLACAQTPQGFHFSAILEAHRTFAEGGAYTDDAALAEAAGLAVLAVQGAAHNVKVTQANDIATLEALMRPAMPHTETRTGFGFDVHRVKRHPEHAEKREMVLCGLPIPSDYYLEGHSDADAALHALTDALLGALAEGDIGLHFPPSDVRWKGADSVLFLTHALGLLAARGGTLIHADLTIIGEEPKISPHRDVMRTRLATLLEVEKHRVSVKATTTEKLGFTGRGEGLAAQAVVTVSVPGEGT